MKTGQVIGQGRVGLGDLVAADRDGAFWAWRPGMFSHNDEEGVGEYGG
jgi:hypothetical protein